MRQRRRRLFRLALPAALLVIVGVTAVLLTGDDGTDTTEAEKVEAAFQAYQGAIAARDSAKLCELTSPATHQAIREQFGKRGRTACQDFYELAFDESPRSALDGFSRVKIESVEVHGKTATVRFHGRGEMKFVKVGGRWLDFHEFGG
jgi:predicted lipid-binding transport protein (Tim44 family)